MMSIEIHALTGIPDVKAEDDLAQFIVTSMAEANLTLRDNDIFVIAQKIVSKAEGQTIHLTDITPSERAEEIAHRTNKDPRKIEMILRESRKILKIRDASDNNEGTIITLHNLGFVSANAGIDESNLDGVGDLLLLPRDPDNSARTLRENIHSLTHKSPGIVISDTFGRPWRLGQVNVAIGLAAVPALIDLTGQNDAWGNRLNVTKPAFADELAAASGLLMDKQTKSPVILFRGLNWQPSDSPINDLLRPKKEDLF